MNKVYGSLVHLTVVLVPYSSYLQYLWTGHRSAFFGCGPVGQKYRATKQKLFFFFFFQKTPVVFLGLSFLTVYLSSFLQKKTPSRGGVWTQKAMLQRQGAQVFVMCIQDQRPFGLQTQRLRRVSMAFLRSFFLWFSTFFYGYVFYGFSMVFLWFSMVFYIFWLAFRIFIIFSTPST